MSILNAAGIYCLPKETWLEHRGRKSIDLVAMRPCPVPLALPYELEEITQASRFLCIDDKVPLTTK